MLEQEYESITEFRQATNVKLNNIRTQINTLAYGADSGVLKQSAEVQQTLNSLLVDDRVSTDSSELIAAGNYIRNEIMQKWVMPANAVTGMVVELVIQLLPSGEVISIEVSYRDASATDSFVNSVIRAVKKVQSFSKLSQLNPALFDANFRKFTLKFKPEDLRI
ncbi:TonB C-terminal domain-containing protein [Oceanospirillaceae bacterium]|nr:TonB C-terminal domain-containing protein [Oceanospirillaceae bacterium]